ncbi:MAG: hypothetical protein AB7V27_03050 [Candidatus Binatia bacterium]
MTSHLPVFDLLGSRGTLGRALARRLVGRFTVTAWSGAEGAGSYAAYAEMWRARGADGAQRPAVLAHGGAAEDASSLLRDLALRTASFIDLWDATKWPARLVLLGSASELLPDSLYGAAKRAQRDIAETAARRAGTHMVTLRVHSLVPDGLPARGIFRDLLTCFRAGGPVRVRHLAGMRDYLSEEQLAAVAGAALVAPPDRLPQVLDVGSGRGRRVMDWIEGFRAAFGIDAELRVERPDAVDAEIVADTAPLEALLAAVDSAGLARWLESTPDPAACAARWRQLCG